MLRGILAFTLLGLFGLSTQADSTLGCRKFGRAPDWVNMFTPLQVNEIKTGTFTRSSGTYYLADIYLFENGTYALEYTEEEGSCNPSGCQGTPTYKVLLEGHYRRGTDILLENIGNMAPTQVHGHDAYVLNFSENIYTDGLTEAPAVEEKVISGECSKGNL